MYTVILSCMCVHTCLHTYVGAMHVCGVHIGRIALRQMENRV